ncbi:MAG TPA: hypothetical protein VK983_05245 [Candidatus Limnocylindrales bacterium]|nr:hypothetical protein [Candidatus Limnocylindrales bacterium]
MPRRTNYPFLNLAEAVERVSILRKNLGSGPYGNESIIKALGYNGPSGAANRALASLSHYQLLERTGDGYKLSDLSTRIVRPISEEDKIQAIREAAGKPKLFRELLDLYNGEELPKMLDNYLIHQLKMTDDAAKKASNVFKKTINFAGLVDASGNLQSYKIEEKLGNETPSITGSTHLIEHGRSNSSIAQGNTDQISRRTDLKRLPSGITIAFPPDLDFAVLMGAFADPIRQMEEIAQAFTSQEQRMGGQYEKETEE